VLLASRSRRSTMEVAREGGFDDFSALSQTAIDYLPQFHLHSLTYKYRYVILLPRQNSFSKIPGSALYCSIGLKPRQVQVSPMLSLLVSRELASTYMAHRKAHYVWVMSSLFSSSFHLTIRTANFTLGALTAVYSFIDRQNSHSTDLRASPTVIAIWRLHFYA
jgi:hypothetical protein